jgi:D-hexose-6-phosphate mutarotase
MSSITERDGVLRLHVDDAWTDVALFGSTVIGWHPASSQGKEKSLIFLSKDTKPGKAYRGGIPLVFPVFGEVKDHGEVPDAIKNCTRHGFCRDRAWTLVEKKSDESGTASVSMSLSSKDQPALLEKFPCPFALLHTVTLTKDTLESRLQVQHLDSSQHDSMPFHALFHTYLGLPNQTAKAYGLKGVGFNDKVAAKRVGQNDDEQQGWSEEIDRVYEGKAEMLVIDANDESGDQITLERSNTLPDTTLWNPGKAADENMGDLHQGGWKEFVCAEPGHVSSFAWLEKGKEWTGIQTLSYKNIAGSSTSSEKETGKDAALTAAGAGGAAGIAKSAHDKTSQSTANKGKDDQDAGPKDGKEAVAASVIQRQYRSYVSRREQDGLRLSPDARWGDAVGRARIDGATKAAMSGSKNDSTNRWKRGGLLVGQLAGSPSTQLDQANTGPVEGGPSLEPHPSLDAAMKDRTGSDMSAPSREESKGVIGDVPGANDNGKVDNIRSIADKNQHGLKMIERWTRGAPAQELSKVMEAQYWLEMVDRKHRYGSNLKYYHQAWSNDKETKDNFFKWLDEGKGKEMDLPECSREQLEREQVTYLSSEQRANYIVDVKEGRLVWRRNGKFVDTTTGRWRDLGDGRGIVELGEEEQAELRRQREERAARKGHKLRDDNDSLSSSSSSSSSDDDGEGALNSEEEQAEKDRARHYGGDDGKNKGLKSFTPAGTWDRLLRKTVQNNVWIYVYNSRHELFVGIKTTGKFQHSSFLYGGRVLSAGLLRVKDGYLTSLSPLSGHYRAGSAHFRFFVASLQDSKVDLSNVTLSKSLLMLHGLEQYGKLNKKLKGKGSKDKKAKRATEKKEKHDEAAVKNDKEDATKKGGLSSKLEKLNLHKLLGRSKGDEGGQEAAS